MSKRTMIALCGAGMLVAAGTASAEASGYDQFVELAQASGIDLSQHPTYSEGYFNDRSSTYCGLLSQGELMKIVSEIQFPPIADMTESPKDRPRLEVAILRVGTASFCPDYTAQEQQIEGTIMR